MSKNRKGEMTDPGQQAEEFYQLLLEFYGSEAAVRRNVRLWPHDEQEPLPPGLVPRGSIRTGKKKT